eukprot:scaffold101422_cov32-Tisochrysis_lutea.AAC.2
MKHHPSSTMPCRSCGVERVVAAQRLPSSSNGAIQAKFGRLLERVTSLSPFEKRAASLGGGARSWGAALAL